MKASGGANHIEARLLLSAGRGPDECCWAVAELVGRLERDARAEHLTVRRVETIAGPSRRGWSSAVLSISGPAAHRFADGWTGTLCWQAPSPYRRGVKRKNWFVIAERLDGPQPAVQVEESEITFEPCRTGGPGGQHRNKSYTGVRATHQPSGLTVVAGNHRSSQANRADAVRQITRTLTERDQAERANAATEQWRTHDRVVRGNPTRTERPRPAKPS